MTGTDWLLSFKFGGGELAVSDESSLRRKSGPSTATALPLSAQQSRRNPDPDRPATPTRSRKPASGQHVVFQGDIDLEKLFRRDRTTCAS